MRSAQSGSTSSAQRAWLAEVSRPSISCAARRKRSLPSPVMVGPPFSIHPPAGLRRFVRLAEDVGDLEDKTRNGERRDSATAAEPLDVGVPIRTRGPEHADPLPLQV